MLTKQTTLYTGYPAFEQPGPEVLNSDENIVNIALVAFCSLAVTKLAYWPMSSLLSCGVGLLQLPFVLALL